MKSIIAIGGGEITKKETLAIDREIIRLSGKKNPKLLFIPTASYDSEDYWRDIQNYFGDFLGCKTDVLLLIQDKPSASEVEEKILSSDIVYVGGGNTLKMIRIWKKMGVDRVLQAAYEKGIVLCGISAGSICWFESGHSDSMSFYHPDRWKYINVHGLGFLKGIHCPHYNGRTLGVLRKKNFQDMISKIGGMGIAIDNNCAIEFIDGTYRVITSKPSAGAYHVYKEKGKVVSKKIEEKTEFSPIAEFQSLQI